MYVSPFDTTAAVSIGFKADKLSDSIKRYYYDNAQPKIKGYNNEGTDPILIASSSFEIAQFAHPCLVEVYDRQQVAIDVRNAVRYDKDTSQYIIVQKDYFSFSLLRGALTDNVCKHGVSSLGGLVHFGLLFYGTWIGEAVARSMALDPRTQMHVTIIASIFYLTLFREDVIGREPLSEKEKLKFIGLISRQFKYPIEDVTRIIDNIPLMVSVVDMCNVLAESTDSARLSKFNVGVLFTIIGGGWFGFNAREMTAIATEHVPTLFSIIYFALKSRSYKKTPIGKIIQRLEKNEYAVPFVRGITKVPSVTDFFSGEPDIA